MEDFFEDLRNKPRPNIFKRIHLWWKYDGRYLHREIKTSIKKVWYWLPIIWKDRDWDSHYIFEVMKHKLKAQTKYIGERNFYTKAQQDARRMRICVKLIQKIQDDEYSAEYMDYVKDKHWFEDCEDKPGYTEWKSEIISENYDEYFKKYPLIYKRVINGERVFEFDNVVDTESKMRIAMNIANINQNRAQKLLFKILEENILGWWD